MLKSWCSPHREEEEAEEYKTGVFISFPVTEIYFIPGLFYTGHSLSLKHKSTARVAATENQRKRMKIKINARNFNLKMFVPKTFLVVIPFQRFEFKKWGIWTGKQEEAQPLGFAFVTTIHHTRRRSQKLRSQQSWNPATEISVILGFEWNN